MVTANELPPPSPFRYKFVSLQNVTAHGVTAVSVYYEKVVSLLAEKNIENDDHWSRACFFEKIQLFAAR